MRFFKLLLLGCLFFCGNQLVQAQSYQTYAVYMYSFTRYIDWPATDSDEFVIGVVGESPIMPHLSRMASQKRVDNRNIRVVKYDSPDEVSGNDAMIFMSESWSANRSAVDKIANKGKSPCLVITDKQSSFDNGHINFIVEGERLIFELNKSEIEKAGLQVSSELLALAKVVE